MEKKRGGEGQNKKEVQMERSGIDSKSETVMQRDDEIRGRGRVEGRQKRRGKGEKKKERQRGREIKIGAKRGREMKNRRWVEGVRGREGTADTENSTRGWKSRTGGNRRRVRVRRRRRRPRSGREGERGGVRNKVSLPREKCVKEEPDREAGRKRGPERETAKI